VLLCPTPSIVFLRALRDSVVKWGFGLSAPTIKDMRDDDLVVVHTFSNQFEADMAISALEAAEIDAIIQADTAGGMRPHIAWASGGFKVLVREEDALEAKEILECRIRPE